MINEIGVSFLKNDNFKERLKSSSETYNDFKNIFDKANIKQNDFNYKKILNKKEESMSSTNDLYSKMKNEPSNIKSLNKSKRNVNSTKNNTEVIKKPLENSRNCEDNLEELEKTLKSIENEGISLLEIIEISVEQLNNSINDETDITKMNELISNVDETLTTKETSVENNKEIITLIEQLNNDLKNIQSEFSEKLKMIENGNNKEIKNNDIQNMNVSKEFNKIIESLKNIIANGINQINRLENNVKENDIVLMSNSKKIFDELNIKIKTTETSMKKLITKVDDLLGLMSDSSNLTIEKQSVSLSSKSDNQIKVESQENNLDINLKNELKTNLSTSNESGTDTNSDSKSNNSEGTIINNMNSMVDKSLNLNNESFEKILNNESIEKDVGQQVYKQMRKVKLQNGDQTIRMILKPEALGEISLKMSFNKGVLTTQFIAENELTKQLLEKNITQLKEQLETQGYEIKEFKIINKEETQANNLNEYDEQQNSNNSNEKRKKEEKEEKNTDFDSILNQVDEII